VGPDLAVGMVVDFVDAPVVIARCRMLSGCCVGLCWSRVFVTYFFHR
jgi:hypothetical protein